MPVIAVISPKGGAGKSTLANIIATTFHANGATVAIVDCDNEKSQAKWFEGDFDLGEPRKVLTKFDISIVADVGERNIYQTIDKLKGERQFVVIDTEGTASLVVSRAIMRADLVLIPVKPSPKDIDGARKAIRLVKEEEVGLGRAINYACVMVETPDAAFKTKIQRAWEAQARADGVKILSTGLGKREAFKSIWFDRVALHELDPTVVSKLDAAISNATQLAGEVFETLQSGKSNKMEAA